ncbi:MAG TPA: hypothetical protein VHT34_05895 [Clostridia bacterium]|nr:hypothetical protein [Clostridia bacterium]
MASGIKNIYRCIRTVRNDIRGQGLTEYVFLASLIAMITITALGILGIKLFNLFENFTNQVPN